MARPPEQAERNTRPDSKETEDEAPPSKSDLLRLKLKIVAHYVTLGFAPIVAAVALTLAVIALIGNQDNQEQLGQSKVQLNEIISALPASKNELEKFKTVIAQEQTTQDEARKKLEERMEKIVLNVTQLQIRMKISPTLAEQLQQPASAPVATTSPVCPPAASATAAAAAKAAAPKPVEKKFSPQVQSMKEAIEHYNKQ